MSDRPRLWKLWDHFDDARRAQNDDDAWWWRRHLFAAIRRATPDGWDGVLVERTDDATTGTLIVDGTPVARLTIDADGNMSEWVVDDGL